MLPLALILSSILLVLAYDSVLEGSIQTAWATLSVRGVVVQSSQEILQKLDYTEIPNRFLLMACYLGIFLTAELAFLMMALREYLQDLLGLTDERLIRGESAA